MKAMILAAGRGTRMKPLTDRIPKVLVQINHVPLLEYAILYLKHYGVKEIIINLHHHAEQIRDFLQSRRNFGIRIDFSMEADALMDTGGGLYKARGFFDDGKPFFVMASDVVTDLNLEALYDFHLKHMPVATLAVKNRKSTRAFLFDHNHSLAGWRNNLTGDTRMSREIRDPQAIAFSAVQVVDPSLFGLVTEKGSFSLVDLYLRLATDHMIKGFKHDDSEWFEFGRIENLDMNEKEGIIRRIYQKHV